MPTIQIENAGGHVLVPIDGKRAILDTGSPVSMANGSFQFLGRQRLVPRNIMGLTPEKMSELAGFQIDILIGCDILSEQALRIRWRDLCLDFGDDIPDGPLVSELTSVTGIPIFPVRIRGNSTRAIFDTGAHLSYIKPELVAGQEPSGRRSDFYPIVGQFVAPTYIVPMALDNSPMDMEFGILPDSLQMMLGLIMTMTGSSAVIGTQLLDFFDCTIAWGRNRISWGRVG